MNNKAATLVLFVRLVLFAPLDCYSRNTTAECYNTAEMYSNTASVLGAHTLLYFNVTQLLRSTGPPAWRVADPACGQWTIHRKSRNGKKAAELPTVEYDVEHEKYPWQNAWNMQTIDQPEESDGTHLGIFVSDGHQKAREQEPPFFTRVQPHQGSINASTCRRRAFT